MNDDDGPWTTVRFLSDIQSNHGQILRGRGFPCGGAAGGVSAVAAEDGGDASSSLAASDAVRGKTTVEGKSTTKMMMTE